MESNRGTEESALRRKFDEADADGSGMIDRGEYLRLALVDALAKSKQRVLDLLDEVDSNRNRKVSQAEFRRAVRSLSFQASNEDIDRVFDAFDMDGSGEIDFKELATALKPETVARNRYALRNKLSSRATPSAAPMAPSASAAAATSSEPIAPTAPAGLAQRKPSAGAPRDAAAAAPAERKSAAAPATFKTAVARAASPVAMVRSITCSILGLHQPATWRRAAALDIAAAALTVAWAAASAVLLPKLSVWSSIQSSVGNLLATRTVSA